MLTVAEVATELGCGRDTVRGLLSSGVLPSVRVGGPNDRPSDARHRG